MAFRAGPAYHRPHTGAVVPAPLHLHPAGARVIFVFHLLDKLDFTE